MKGNFKNIFKISISLEIITNKKTKDVRISLKQFRDKMIENINRGVNNPHLNLKLDDWGFRKKRIINFKNILSWF